MTDISRHTTAFQVEDRSWLYGLHGTDQTPPATLDVSAFTQADHYPNGYIPSGIVLKEAISGGKTVYVPTIGDGSDTAAGILYGSLKIPDLLDLSINVSGAILVHGFVKISRLPIPAGTAGAFHASNLADLPMIHFAA